MKTHGTQESGRQVTLIRVFVSSPGDVGEERAVLDEVVRRINDTDGQRSGARLELFKWENSVAPQIGPGPQQVVDRQTPHCDVYLGIMSTRFGTPTKSYGSGTEAEFRDAVKNWSEVGAPWILFYFDEQPPLPKATADLQQYLRVRQFHDELEGLGIVGLYTGVRGNETSFVHRVEQHLRLVMQRIVEGPPAGPGGEETESSSPDRYLRWLLNRTSFIDIRGLNVGTGKVYRFSIDDLFIALRTHLSDREPDSRRPSRSKSEKAAMPDASRSVELRAALEYPRLAVVGDPGSGKTTFLRRVCYALCTAALHDDSKAAQWVTGTTAVRKRRRKAARKSGPGVRKMPDCRHQPPLGVRRSVCAPGIQASAYRTVG